MDFNQDGQVTARDAADIARYMAEQSIKQQIIINKTELETFNILETKSEVKNKLISDSVTGSPKTGTHGVGLVFSIITVSGTIAFITRKKY